MSDVPLGADGGATPRRVRRALVVVTAVAIVLRLFRLGSQSVWIDEVITLIVTTPKRDYPIWQLLAHNIHGPLHAFVVYLFRGIAGGDAWLRLPSALAGTASVPLLYAWVRPRFGHSAALWSALFLALSPLHVHYSQELRNYAFVVFFVLAGCVQLDRVCARWSTPRAAGLALCIAAAVLSNFSAMFTFAAQTISYFHRSRFTGRSLLRWAGVTALVVVIASPWIYRVTTYVDFGKLVTPVMPGELDVTERLRGETTFRLEAIPYAAYAYSVGFSLGPSLRELHGEARMGAVLARHGWLVAWVALLFGGLAVTGAWRRGRHGRGAAVWEAAAYILIPLVATLALNWQNAKAFNVRYVIVGLPMYVSLLAAGVSSMGGRLGRAAGVMVVATCALALAHYYFDPAYAKEDVRGAVREVEKRMRPDDCIFAPAVFQIVERYQTVDAPVFTVYRDPPGLMERQLQDLFAGCRAFWYVRARPWVDDADGEVSSAVESHCRLVDSFERPGVWVGRFVCPDSTR